MEQSTTTEFYRLIVVFFFNIVKMMKLFPLKSPFVLFGHKFYAQITDKISLSFEFNTFKISRLVI